MTEEENEDGFLFYYGDRCLGDVSNLKIIDDPMEEVEIGAHVKDTTEPKQ